MAFIETRGNDGAKPQKVNFSEAILSPSASFGGLYVPETFPALDSGFIAEYKTKSYKELAKAVLKLYKIDIDEASIDEALTRYDAFDDANDPVPLTQIEENLHVCELWHGPTRAFKDMALQPFGTLLSKLAGQKKENYLILAATSGDTGPAALSTFEEKPYIKVACLYPEGGTSDVQRLQMVTMKGENLKVIGINGNFDDAQNALKSLLASADFKETLAAKDIKLSAANSVNFGRIIFQIIYHVHSYIRLVKAGKISEGEKINLVIPSGNFGNALGAYYAKKMGVPVNKILIASNENNVLTELINEGKYDLRHKHLVNTTSPAMDILKSSNVERVLYDLFGAARTKELMENLEKENHYELTADELATVKEIFGATYSSDEEVAKVINRYAAKGYIMDTHTATCLKSYDELADKNEQTVIYSTAEWSKFSPVVYQAVHGGEKLHDKEALEHISEQFKIAIPDSVKALFTQEIVHNTVIDKEQITDEIVKFL